MINLLERSIEGETRSIKRFKNLMNKYFLKYLHNYLRSNRSDRKVI